MDSLDIFRGLMAFAVAIYHFANWYPVFPAGQFAAYTTKKVGAYGVEGFFIISGFCFFYLYGAEVLTGRGLRDFHLKRFFRIAPLYYLAVAANLVFGLEAGPGHTLRMVAENGTFTFGLIHPNHSLVTGGWSIGMEYVFYLAFPLLAWAAARWKPFLAVGTLALLALSAPWSFTYVPQASFDGDMKFHAYVQVANHAFLFLMGGLVAQARLAWKGRLTTLQFLGLCLALVLAFTLRHRNFYDDFEIMVGWPRYYFCLVCFAAVAVFAFYDFPDSLVKTAGKFLGEVSYSVYLLHPLVQEGLLHAVPGGLGPWTGFFLGLALTIGLSALTFRFIEKPMMGLGRRLSRT
ncbi:acyltransferase [Geothrix sp. 21YS21S-2]|uniref:acyltransferase family protein n=1 Tax=Geothrix sp. 21YS21S-2 TaxID=3068893 RepID=UPI0027BA2ADA|nr:acyltransferase [Geothrix sp. 21YS21S-2]